MSERRWTGARRPNMPKAVAANEKDSVDAPKPGRASKAVSRKAKPSNRPRQRARDVKPATTKKVSSREHAVSLRAFALVLTVVLGLLGVSQPLHQWWAQQREYRSILMQIEQAQLTNEQLQQELDRWADKSYVASQARARLHYVMPGETQFQVLDAPGIDDDMVTTTAVQEQGPPRPWYLVVLDTADAADDPNPPVHYNPSGRVNKSEE